MHRYKVQWAAVFKETYDRSRHGSADMKTIDRKEAGYYVFVVYDNIDIGTKVDAAEAAAFRMAYDKYEHIADKDTLTVVTTVLDAPIEFIEALDRHGE